MKKQLRDYQSNTAKVMLEHEAERLCICAPTGSGKTQTFSAYTNAFIKSHPTNKVYIAVNRIELLKQTVNTLKTQYGIFPGIIDRDTKSKPMTAVTVCMVETLYRRAKKWNFQDVDVLIIDECHIGDYFKILSLFKKVFGFSATPIYNKRGYCLADWYHDIYIPTSISKLIQDGILCKAITYAPRIMLDKASVKTKGDDYDFDQMGELLSDVVFINQVVNYWRRFSDKRAMVYNSSIEHSKKVCAALKLAGCNARHLDGNTPDHERKHIFKWLADTPGAWLCNVAVATTGVDVPEVEIIMVNLLIKSLSRYLQICGRGSRTIQPAMRDDFIYGKDTFTILDMHGSCLSLGEWQEERDWEMMFRRKKKKGEGVAPVKHCPQCDAIVSASASVCKYCNYVFDIEMDRPPMDEYDPELQVVNRAREYAARQIMIRDERGHKEWSPFYKSMEHYKNEVQKGKISIGQFRLAMMQVAEVFYAKKGVEKMNKGHKMFINERIDEAIESIEIPELNSN